MREIIFSAELCSLYRKKETDFTRARILPFWQVIGLILSGHKLSLQNALNKGFKALGKIFQVPTAGDYCQARQKIKAEVFVHLNKSVVADFYELLGAEEKVEWWHGHRLVGSDGTYLNLPDTPKLRKAFSVHRNQHKGEKQATVQALGMVMYDLLNDVGLKGAIAPSHSAEKSLLCEQLWGELKVGDVLVLDRHSADYTLIGKAVKQKIGVVIRCPRQSFKAVMDFYAGKEREQIVTLGVPQSVRTQKYVKEHQLPAEIEVRLLKFKLASGEEEVLLTTLLDQKEYRRKEFYEVYGWRWGDETYYDRLKNIFEIERFSGLSDRAVSNKSFTESSFWQV